MGPNFPSSTLVEIATPTYVRALGLMSRHHEIPWPARLLLAACIGGAAISNYEFGSRGCKPTIEESPYENRSFSLKPKKPVRLGIELTSSHPSVVDIDALRCYKRATKEIRWAF
uniref:Uncharacterized protein n=1 Tax=Oryza sativa subsp. japonica TaxID=39947 RepID=Q8GVS3_ORYSJ|nr:hypothetical protein [Oryza sativa Japonica Group]